MEKKGVPSGGNGVTCGRRDEEGGWTADTFLPLEELLYWTEREEGKDSPEPLGYLGAHFPTGCRYCI